MGMIDQMKYAKILYLADILEDIQNEMRKNYHCRNFAENISGVVKDLRETIADTATPYEMACEQIEIKRLEQFSKFGLLDVPSSELENYEKKLCHVVEDRLLQYIKKSKLIRVRRQENNDHNVILTASLIVGIEKQPYVPEEPRVSLVDNLAKYLDETRE